MNHKFIEKPDGKKLYYHDLNSNDPADNISVDLSEIDDLINSKVSVPIQIIDRVRKNIIISIECIGRDLSIHGALDIRRVKYLSYREIEVNDILNILTKSLYDISNVKSHKNDMMKSQVGDSFTITIAMWDQISRYVNILHKIIEIINE